MKSNLLDFVNEYKKNALEVSKSKFILEHLLVYFKVEATIMLKKLSPKLGDTRISSKLEHINNIYVLKIFIPDNIKPFPLFYENREVIQIDSLHQLLVLEYINAIYALKNEKNLSVIDFIYETYYSIDSIIRNNKVAMILED